MYRSIGPLHRLTNDGQLSNLIILPDPKNIEKNMESIGSPQVNITTASKLKTCSRLAATFTDRSGQDSPHESNLAPWE